MTGKGGEGAQGSDGMKVSQGSEVACCHVVQPGVSCNLPPSGRLSLIKPVDPSNSNVY
jgi:hypothetical protein